MLLEESENIKKMEEFCGKDEFSLRYFKFDALTERCSVGRFINPGLKKDLGW